MTHRKGRKPRRGITIVAVLVCLFVIVHAGRRAPQDGPGRAQQQSRSGAAGCRLNGSSNRASSVHVARIAADRSYAGEKWSIAAADLGLPEASPATGTAESDRKRGGLGDDLG